MEQWTKADTSSSNVFVRVFHLSLTVTGKETSAGGPSSELFFSLVELFLSKVCFAMFFFQHLDLFIELLFHNLVLFLLIHLAVCLNSLTTKKKKAIL